MQIEPEVVLCHLLRKGAKTFRANLITFICCSASKLNRFRKAKIKRGQTLI